MFQESLLYIAFLVLVLVPPVSAAGALPTMYIVIIGVVLFIVLVAIAARIADRYHLWESINKLGTTGYPEDDGRYEMKVFKGHGFGEDDNCPSPVLYEKRRHDKRGLNYQELENEVNTVAQKPRSPVAVVKPKAKEKLSKKERKEVKERQLREALSRSISKDGNASVAFNTDNEPTYKAEAGIVPAVSPRQSRAVLSPKNKRVMSPPPPPNPRTDIPTSPSQKRAMSPTPRKPANPVSPTPAPRAKTPRSHHNTLPASGPDHAGSSEPVAGPTGYHYPTLPAGYYPPHPGAHPPVPPSPVYPVYPYPQPAPYPVYPPQSAENASPQPVPMQPAAYHMPYPYPHPGYYPPHPAYPPTTPGVSQSKHQSQL